MVLILLALFLHSRLRSTGSLDRRLSFSRCLFVTLCLCLSVFLSLPHLIRPVGGKVSPLLIVSEYCPLYSDLSTLWPTPWAYSSPTMGLFNPSQIILVRGYFCLLLGPYLIGHQIIKMLNNY